MTKTEKRPKAITILGYLLIIGGALFVLKIALLGGSFSTERNIVNIILKSLSIVTGIGYLKMKKWGFYLWIVGFVVGTILLFVWPPSEGVLESYSSFMGIILLIFVPFIITKITLQHWKEFK